MIEVYDDAVFAVVGPSWHVSVVEVEGVQVRAVGKDDVALGEDSCTVWAGFCYCCCCVAVAVFGLAAVVFGVVVSVFGVAVAEFGVDVAVLGVA